MPIFRSGSRRNRRTIKPDSPTVGVDSRAIVSISAGKMLLTFDTAVVVRGVPQSIKVAGVAPVAVTQPTPQTVLLEYAAPVVAGQAWVIGHKDTAVRSSTGGYAVAAAGTF